MTNKSKASMIVGIIGIVMAFFSPIIGVILGVIGLAIKKEKGHEDRDKVLNILAIGISVLIWVLTIAFIEYIPWL